MAEHNTDTDAKNRVAKLQRLRFSAGSVLVFEYVWPRVLPLLLILSLLITLAWFGLFQIMPRWLHIGLLGLLALSILGSLYRLRSLRWPDAKVIDQRLEQENYLPHQALQLSKDRIAGDSSDPLTQALWLEHQKRMVVKTRDLHGFLPHPHIPQSDPYAVRAVIPLLLVVAGAFSFSSSSGRVSDLWTPAPAISGPEVRFDAWITPPAYTGRAPVFLTTQHDDDADDVQQKPIEVPQGSLLSIQISDPAHAKLQLTDTDGKTVHISSDTSADADRNKPQSVFEQKLDTSVEAQLTAGSRQKTWNITVVPDRAPVIAFTKDPTYALNGTLELHYRVDDDYGATSITADMQLQEPSGTQAKPLYSAPELRLSLPPRGRKGGQNNITAKQDLTAHVWAGKYVSLQLQVSDEAGQIAKTPVIKFILPQRPFINPLARAVVEQRQILSFNPARYKAVIQMLDTLTMHPETTIANVSHFLGLRSIRERLKLARNEDDLRNISDYMWEVARGIEDGQLSDAEKNLKAAQEALQQALQNNAGPDEIARLSEALRQAMQKYLSELARRQMESPNKAAQPDANARVLSQRDLDRMMQQIEDLARSGNHEQAQQLLSQLQDMLNNLQTGQSGGKNAQGEQRQGEGNAAQQQMNKLGDLMRRQQELMNETFKLDQQLQDQLGDHGYDGEGDQPDAQQNNQAQQDSEQALKKLEQQQKDLQSELQELNRQLQQQGLQPNKDMDQAQGLMGRAQKSLGQGESGQATDRQGEALEALRRGARDMMQQMQNAQGQGAGQGNGQGGTQQQGQGQDPLGRDSRSGGGQGDDTVKIPGEIDIQKARRILDEIRKKLGDALSPQQEKDYLERLLKKD